jgi:hypothetical protein
VATLSQIYVGSRRCRQLGQVIRWTVTPVTWVTERHE